MTAECSLRPGGPPGGRPIRGGYVMSSGRVFLYLAHSFLTQRADTPIDRAISASLSTPLRFSRTIHLTCSWSSLCTTRSFLPFLNLVLIFVRRSWDDPHTSVSTP